MDKELARLERETQLDPSNLGLLRRLARARDRVGWTYKGRSLDEWSQRVFLRPFQESKEAMEVLSELGTLGLPGLIAGLKSPGNRIRRQLLPLIKSHGAKAREAIPAVICCANKKTIVKVVPTLRALGLEGIIERALPEFRGLVSAHVHFPRVLLLADQVFELAGVRALPCLIELLRDSQEEAKLCALKALVRLGAEASEAVEEIVALLQTDQYAVCQASLTALASIGPAASVSVPSLVNLMTDGLYGGEARVTLAAIGSPVLSELMHALESGEGYLRQCAVLTLGKLGEKARAAIPKLKQLLDHEDRQLAVEAALALQKIDPQNPHSASVLIKSQVREDDECFEWPARRRRKWHHKRRLKKRA